MDHSRLLWAKAPLETGRRLGSGWFPAMTPNLGDDYLKPSRLKDCK